MLMVVMLVMRVEMGLVVMLHRNPVVTQSVLRGLGHSLKDSHTSPDASLALQELLEGCAVLLWLVFLLLMLSDTGTLQAHHSSANSAWRAGRGDVSPFQNHASVCI